MRRQKLDQAEKVSRATKPPYQSSLIFGHRNSAHCLMKFSIQFLKVKIHKCHVLSKTGGEEVEDPYKRFP